MKKPKNDNIGLGLAATRTISRKMGGDLTLKQSQVGLTVFNLLFPVSNNYKPLNIFNNQNGFSSRERDLNSQSDGDESVQKSRRIKSSKLLDIIQKKSFDIEV